LAVDGATLSRRSDGRPASRWRVDALPFEPNATTKRQGGWPGPRLRPAGRIGTIQGEMR